MDELTLHDMQLSGNCYRIRLTAALIGVKLKLIEYDLLNGATRTPDFLTKINPNGKIPVLQIGKDIFLPESYAACFYLARTASNPKTTLVPEDKLEHAWMLQWMFFEQYSYEPAIAVLRFWYKFIGEANLSEEQRMLIPSKRKLGEKALDVMEEHLKGRKFFVGESLTLADVGLYAYTHCAHESGFDLEGWPSVKEWCGRVARVEGFVSMEE